MALIFYPHSDEARKGSLSERVEVLMEAAGRYKAVILDETSKNEGREREASKRSVPRDLQAAYNWEEISRLLREIRELPEASKNEKLTKGDLLARLAEVYEVLRGAKMSKLEAVRLALISEAGHLRGGNSPQVA